MDTLEETVPGRAIGEFQEAMHSPQVSELNNATLEFIPALVNEVGAADLETLMAYIGYHVLTAFAGRLPKQFDQENFDFYGLKLYGQPEQAPRWKRCSNSVNNALGEALGKVYVDQYFAGDRKAKMLEMVHDIEAAMDRDI